MQLSKAGGLVITLQLTSGTSHFDTTPSYGRFYAVMRVLRAAKRAAQWGQLRLASESALPHSHIQPPITSLAAAFVRNLASDEGGKAFYDLQRNTGSPPPAQPPRALCTPDCHAPPVRHLLAVANLTHLPPYHHLGRPSGGLVSHRGGPTPPDDLKLSSQAVWHRRAFILLLGPTPSHVSANVPPPVNHAMCRGFKTLVDQSEAKSPTVISAEPNQSTQGRFVSQQTTGAPQAEGGPTEQASQGAGWTRREVLNAPNVISLLRLASGPVIAHWIVADELRIALAALVVAGTPKHLFMLLVLPIRRGSSLDNFYFAWALGAGRIMQCVPCSNCLALTEALTHWQSDLGTLRGLPWSTMCFPAAAALSVTWLSFLQRLAQLIVSVPAPVEFRATTLHLRVISVVLHT